MTQSGPDLEHPLGLVTGASSGIGYHLAREFAAHGFDLLVVAEDDRISDVATELSGGGLTARAICADLATAAGIEHVADTLTAEARPLAAAALNAGVVNHGRFDQSALDDDLRLIGVNVVAPVHLAKILVRDMVRQGSGRLLFTSSIASQMPGPYYATYAASKSFLQSFAEAIRHELEGTGVTVTALMPGPTDTDIFDRAGMGGTRVAEGGKDDPATVARQGFEAMMAGRDQVVPGSARNRLQVMVSKFLPDRYKAAMHGAMTKPGGD